MVDVEAFREGCGRLLAEVQRIKSEGDYAAAQRAVRDLRHSLRSGAARRNRRARRRAEPAVVHRLRAAAAGSRSSTRPGQITRRPDLLSAESGAADAGVFGQGPGPMESVRVTCRLLALLVAAFGDLRGCSTRTSDEPRNRTLTEPGIRLVPKRARSHWPGSSPAPDLGAAAFDPVDRSRALGARFDAGGDGPRRVHQPVLAAGGQRRLRRRPSIASVRASR